MSLTRPLISLLGLFINRFPRITTICRKIRDKLDFIKKPIVTPWKFKLAGNTIMAQGIFEPVETSIVRDILEDVDVLVNVGANIGYYCCHALDMGKHVIAFEPIQRNLRYLCRNIKINGWTTNAEIYPIALSNSIGVLEIYGGNTSASIVKGWADIPESYVTLVPSSTLDIVLGTRLQGKKLLIIVDVEGAEKLILEGATKILANNPKPVWLMEISITEHQPQGVVINPHIADTFKYMFEAGYRAFTANKEMRLVSMSHVEAAQKGDTSVFETHNFLFR